MDTSELIKEALKSADTYPTGPVSAWPKERVMEVIAITRNNHENPQKFDEMMKEASVRHPKIYPPARKVKASGGQMISNFFGTATQAIKSGRATEAVRNERYEICKACPSFIEDSKRCSECGCFMEAKTWVGGDPNQLCPLQKWSR